MSGTHRVFVYGTLMKGEQHHNELRTATFIGAAQTPPQYDLVQVSYYPAMIAGGRLRIHGELYEVDDATLARLDILEGIPTLFVRETIKLGDGSEALCYLMPRDRVSGGDPIPSGYFRMRTAPPKRG